MNGHVCRQFNAVVQWPKSICGWCEEKRPRYRDQLRARFARWLRSVAGRVWSER